MKKQIILCLLSYLLISSCNPRENSKNDNTQIEKSKSITYAFSNPNKLDTFKVAIEGKESQNMFLKFSITNAEGTKIYHTQIKALELLKGYDTSAKLKKENEKINFLTEELNSFFEEQHFLEPAIMPDERPDKNVPDLKLYNNLKNNGLNGFEYRISKDKKLYIAWSKENQKVEIYYQCC